MAAGNQPLSIQDAAAYPYSGGTAGALVDIVLIREISQSTVVTEYENKGDGGISAAGADLDGYDLTINVGALNPVSFGAIAGGTVVTNGVAPAALTSWTINKDDVRAYFKLAGQTRAKDAEGGATRVTYPKVGWRGGPDFGLVLDEFAEASFAARAMPDADGDIAILETFEAWVALA